MGESVSAEHYTHLFPMHIAYAGIYALHLHAGIYAVHLHACIPMHKLYEYSAIFVVYVFIQIM